MSGQSRLGQVTSGQVRLGQVGQAGSDTPGLAGVLDQIRSVRQVSLKSWPLRLGQVMRVRSGQVSKNLKLPTLLGPSSLKDSISSSVR